MAGTFAIDLSRFCKKADADMKTVVRKLAFEAFRRVVLKTPVDTGRARANWSVAVGAPNTTSSLLAFDKDGTTTLQKIMDGVNAWSADGSIFLTNNLSYIATLEYGLYPNPPKYGSYVKGLGKGKTVRHQFLSVGGYSFQAANGMVRVTLEEMQAWAKTLR